MKNDQLSSISSHKLAPAQGQDDVTIARKKSSSKKSVSRSVSQNRVAHIQVEVSSDSSLSFEGELRKAAERCDSNARKQDTILLEEDSFSSSMSSSSSSDLSNDNAAMGRPMVVNQYQLNKMQAALGAEPIDAAKENLDSNNMVAEYKKKKQESKKSEFMKYLDMDAQIQIQNRRKSSVQFRHGEIDSEDYVDDTDQSHVSNKQQFKAPLKCRSALRSFSSNSNKSDKDELTPKNQGSTKYSYV